MTEAGAPPTSAPPGAFILRRQKLIRGLVIAWGVFTALWLLFFGLVGGVSKHIMTERWFEYSYVLRDGVTVTRDDAARPLYDLIVPPSQTGRPVEFVPLGHFRPNMAPHDNPRIRHEFSDDTRLFVSEKLAEQDQAFLKAAWQDQRSARRVAWLKTWGDWLMLTVLPPAFLFAIVYLGSRFKLAEAEPPAPEPPRPA